VYEGSCCWLPNGHPYQRNRNPAHFNGKEENRLKLQLMIAIDTLKRVVEWVGVGNISSSKGDPSKVIGIKHRSALYDLPSFEVKFQTSCI